MAESPNAKVWKTYGLLEESHRLADALMATLLPLMPSGYFTGADADAILTVFHAVLSELRFQVVIIPHRNADFQRDWAWVPPEEKEKS